MADSGWLRFRFLGVAVFVLAAVLTGGALPVQAAAPAYHVVSVEVRQVGPLLVTERVVQAGNDPAARFTVHRMRRPGASRGAILLMPGGGSNFAFYATSEDGEEEQDSFAGFFVLHGFDVWGYSPRTRGLAPGACSGTVNCSGMANWGMQAVMNDARYIRERIREVHGADRPVLAGLSLGAMSTLALLNAAPHEWAGAVIWEGMLYSADPGIRAANQVSCDDIEDRIAAGEIWDETLYPIVRLVYDLSIANPSGPTPLAGFPPGFTNRQVFLALLTTPQPAPPAFVPGYTLAVGSVAENRFFYSSEARLAVLIEQLNHYEPLALIRDYTCALAGETLFTAHLGRFRGPVYAIGGGHGFGPWMDDNLALLGSTDITWNFIPELGHGDHFATPEHRRLLERPLLRWLRDVLRDD